MSRYERESSSSYGDRDRNSRGNYRGGNDRRGSYGGDGYEDRGRSSYDRDNKDRDNSAFDDVKAGKPSGQGEVFEAPMPGEWMLIEDSGVPSWDPACLLEEPRPEGWIPPTPPPVPRAVKPFTAEFDMESLDPPRIGMVNKETVLRDERNFDEEEPLLVFNNMCVVRTNLRGIIESKKRREVEDREDEMEFRSRGGFRGRGRGGRDSRGGGRGGRGGDRGGRGGRGGFNRGQEGDANMMPVGQRKRFGDTSPPRMTPPMDTKPSPSLLREGRPPSPRERRAPSENDRISRSPGRSSNAGTPARNYGGDPRLSRTPARSEERNRTDSFSSTPSRYEERGRSDAGTPSSRASAVTPTSSSRGSSGTPSRGPPTGLTGTPSRGPTSGPAGTPQSYKEWKEMRAREKAAKANM